MWSNVTVMCLSALLRTIGERRATQLLPNLVASAGTEPRRRLSGKS
jgi:hypothetical protein